MAVPDGLVSSKSENMDSFIFERDAASVKEKHDMNIYNIDNVEIDEAEADNFTENDKALVAADQCLI